MTSSGLWAPNRDSDPLWKEVPFWYLLWTLFLEVQMISDTSQDGVSCGSESDLRSSQGGAQRWVLNTTLWRGGGAHERCCAYQRHYLGIGYGIHH